MLHGNRSGSRFFTGLVAGALVGTSIGLLAAPKPGKDARSAVRQKAGGYVASIRERRRRGGDSHDDAD